MREKEIEARLKREVEKKGGLALKLISPGMAGVPDRLILLPGGRVMFAETKALRGKLRALQAKRKGQIEKLGFKVLIVDSLKDIDELIEEVST